MADTWRPTPGQVALIEPLGGDQELRTGLVLADAERVIIDLGASTPLVDDPCEVAVSFFAPEALYRLAATATPLAESEGVVQLVVHDVERVQRRSAPRARLALPVALSAFSTSVAFVAVPGETVDLGPGGCRVITADAVPSGIDVTVSVALPSGPPVVALAQVLESKVRPGRCDYRLVFQSISKPDADRLTELGSATIAEPPT